MKNRLQVLEPRGNAQKPRQILRSRGLPLNDRARSCLLPTDEAVILWRVDIASLLWGHSKALYSTWVFYRPDHLLIDCGEGAASALGNGGYGIERVLLTHGHIDHIAGLPALLWTRAGGMGDTDKPLSIFYPAGDPSVALMRDYLLRSRRRWPFELSWIELQPGDSIPLSGEPNAQHARRVRAFETRHIRNQITLGYQILETRRRLKPEFAALSPQEIGKLARDIGSAGLSESFEAALVVWSGDSAPLRPEDAAGTEILMHEATILHDEDKKGQEHSALSEVLQLAAQARPRTLVLYHFSGRYRASEVREHVARSAREHKLECDVWCLVRDKIFPVITAHDEPRSARPKPQTTPQVLEASGATEVLAQGQEENP